MPIPEKTAPPNGGHEKIRQWHQAETRFSKKAKQAPTVTTTAAPTTLYQRKEMSVRVATEATAAMPKIRPKKAPFAVAHFVPIARMKTPRTDP